jgi:hypothetical protein
VKELLGKSLSNKVRWKPVCHWIAGGAMTRKDDPLAKRLLAGTEHSVEAKQDQRGSNRRDRRPAVSPSQCQVAGQPTHNEHAADNHIYQPTHY